MTNITQSFAKIKPDYEDAAQGILLRVLRLVYPNIKPENISVEEMRIHPQGIDRTLALQMQDIGYRCSNEAKTLIEFHGFTPDEQVVDALHKVIQGRGSRVKAWGLDNGIDYSYTAKFFVEVGDLFVQRVQELLKERIESAPYTNAKSTFG